MSDSAIPETTACQARILEWVPFPSPGDLPDPGIEPRSPALQADSLRTKLLEKTPGLALTPDIDPQRAFLGMYSISLVPKEWGVEIP